MLDSVSIIGYSKLTIHGGKTMKTISGILAVVAASAVASAATAQISNVTSTTSATQTLDGVPQMLGSPVPSPNYDNGGPGGAGYSASANITSESIFFQAGSLAAGKGNAASSQVGVSFDVTNSGSEDITKLRSTIFESNFGFYVANFAGGVDDNDELFPNCSGATLPTCLPVTINGGFSNFTDVGQTAPRTLASTQFTFEVFQDGNSIKTVSGSLDMVKGSDNTISFTKGLGFEDLDAVLNNFSLFEVTNRVYAFQWDRTNFTVDLDPILQGSTSNLSYVITSSTQNFGQAQQPLGNLIVAFACFADPVGRGGTRGSIYTIPGLGPTTCNDYAADSGITSPHSFKVPKIIGDTIDFTAPAIPEPDTWAMLIIGFGLVGLSMRRGKKPAVATAS